MPSSYCRDTIRRSSRGPPSSPWSVPMESSTSRHTVGSACATEIAERQVSWLAGALCPAHEEPLSCQHLRCRTLLRFDRLCGEAVASRRPRCLFHLDESVPRGTSSELTRYSLQGMNRRPSWSALRLPIGSDDDPGDQSVPGPPAAVRRTAVGQVTSRALVLRQVFARSTSVILLELEVPRSGNGCARP